MMTHKIILKDVSKRLREIAGKYDEEGVHQPIEIEAAQYIECLELALEMYLEDIKKLRERIK